METRRSPASGLPASHPSRFPPLGHGPHYGHHPSRPRAAGDTHASPSSGYSVSGAYPVTSFSPSPSFASSPSSGIQAPNSVAREPAAPGAVSYMPAGHYVPPAGGSVAAHPSSVTYMPPRGHAPPAGFASYPSPAPGGGASPAYFSTPTSGLPSGASTSTASFTNEDRTQQRSPHLVHSAPGNHADQQRQPGTVSPRPTHIQASSTHYHVRPSLPPSSSHARPSAPQVHAASGYGGAPGASFFPLSSPDVRFPARPFRQEDASAPTTHANGSAFAVNGTTSPYGQRAGTPGETGSPQFFASVAPSPSPQGPPGAAPLESAAQQMPTSNSTGRNASPVHAPAFYPPSSSPSFPQNSAAGAGFGSAADLNPHGRGLTPAGAQSRAHGASVPASEAGAVHACFGTPLQRRASSPLQEVLVYRASGAGMQSGEFSQLPGAVTGSGSQVHGAAPQSPYAPKFGPWPHGAVSVSPGQKAQPQDPRGVKPGGARSFGGDSRPEDIPHAGRSGGVRTPGLDSAASSAFSGYSSAGGSASQSSFSRAPSPGNEGRNGSPIKAGPPGSARPSARGSQTAAPLAEGARLLPPSGRENPSGRGGQSAGSETAGASASLHARPLASSEGGTAGAPPTSRDAAAAFLPTMNAPRPGGAGGTSRPSPPPKGPASALGREGDVAGGGVAPSASGGQGRQLLKTLNFSKTLFVTESFTEKKLNVASNTLRKNYENFVLLRNKNAIVIPGPKKTKDHPRGTIVAYNSGYIVAAATREQFVGMNLSPACADSGGSKKGGVVPPATAPPSKEMSSVLVAPSVQTNAPIYADWIRKKFRSHEAEPLCRSNGFTRPLTVMARADIDPPYEVFLEELRDFLFLHFPHWLVAYDPEVSPCLVVSKANPSLTGPSPLAKPSSLKRNASPKDAAADEDGEASAAAVAAGRKKGETAAEGPARTHRGEAVSSVLPRGSNPGGLLWGASGSPFSCRRKRPFSAVSGSPGGVSPFSAEVENVSALWGVNATQLFFPHLPSHVHLWPPEEKIDVWKRRDEEARAENRSYLQCKFVIGARHVIAHGLKSQQDVHAAMTEFWPILRFFIAPSQLRFRTPVTSSADGLLGEDAGTAGSQKGPMRGLRSLGEDEAGRPEDDLSVAGETVKNMFGELRKRPRGGAGKLPGTPPSQPAASPSPGFARGERGSERANVPRPNSPAAHTGARKLGDASWPPAGHPPSDESVSLQPAVRAEWSSVHLTPTAL
ncbi:conserved hypothetical protein [Neospora caninum Liverpool]|uniref:Uncharacterized protein n=1 Tax=Neospora caninum (strain Liverpool) TaxID=572307 RepID=F0VLY2_NEOCL|nr:conserved hypothetical protein [Neospora caninum Liverpool]CBZ54260.1 conserved hypothetical protein [Neospora caninum Liverpool]CEL68965.1 TPA: hypothetical protein BN1204_046920 [Neospora caninum Liverpool]|eukprot:XP_003884291.1 conserved hypothetical protein [Neospora caninum Liverpool]